MRAARPLAPYLHYPLAPAVAGVFSWLQFCQFGVFIPGATSRQRSEKTPMTANKNRRTIGNCSPAVWLR
jgi:hypothetical protein